ncbi:MAG: N-acetyltransferase [Acidobacteria bacterium]|nr:N-acetyltransferase [Acidobacteriota bacterium]
MASEPPAGMGFEIRLAGPADATAIWRIYNQGIEDRLATFATGMSPLSEVEGWLADSRHRVLLAENYRQPVGWASLRPYREGPAFSAMAEMSVYIDRAWRRHAVGQLLGEALIAEARALGLSKLIGYLLEHNTSSRKLVEKLGFRVVGVHLRHGPPNGAGPNVVVVERLL